MWCHSDLDLSPAKCYQSSHLNTTPSRQFLVEVSRRIQTGSLVWTIDYFHVEKIDILFDQVAHMLAYIIHSNIPASIHRATLAFTWCRIAVQNSFSFNFVSELQQLHWVNYFNSLAAFIKTQHRLRLQLKTRMIRAIRKPILWAEKC